MEDEWQLVNRKCDDITTGMLMAEYRIKLGWLDGLDLVISAVSIKFPLVPDRRQQPIKTPN
jgi:hypothetical protein